MNKKCKFLLLNSCFATRIQKFVTIVQSNGRFYAEQTSFVDEKMIKSPMRH